MMQFIQRLQIAIQMLVGRGKVRLVDDSGVVQLMQVQLGQDEIKDHVRRVAEFGFASSPPPGSDAVLVFIAGDRSRGVVVGTNHQPSRMTGLKAGEVAIFDDQGQSVYLTRGGIVVNGAGMPLVVNNTPTVTVHASTKIVLDTPELDVSGQIKAGGDITDNSGNGGKSMASMRQVYDGHDHNVPGVQSGGSIVKSNNPNQQV